MDVDLIEVSKSISSEARVAAEDPEFVKRDSLPFTDLSCCCILSGVSAQQRTRRGSTFSRDKREGSANQVLQEVISGQPALRTVTHFANIVADVEFSLGGEGRAETEVQQAL